MLFAIAAMPIPWCAARDLDDEFDKIRVGDLPGSALSAKTGRVLRYAYAKWVFRRFRQTSPSRFLQGLGIDVDLALLGFSKWRPRLEAWWRGFAKKAMGKAASVSMTG